MYSIVVLDCDLTSTFAKVNRIDLLEKLFSDDQLVIMASVYNELLEVKQYGFDFPDKVMQSSIGLINIQREERGIFEDFLQDYRIHLGEAEGIAIAKCRNGVFITNDSRAVEFCKEKGVKVLNLKDILRRISVVKIINKEEMVKLIEDIADKDRTFIIGDNDILGEYK
jgi:predicted nucleic acid-binding protein